MSREKILIVEDERIVALEIRERLIELGYQVLDILSSGEKVLKALNSIEPDVILLDIMLEGTMDGIETGKIIREKYGIPFIFLTAYSDELTMRRAMATGPFSYLRKPFEEFELASALQICLSKSKLENELLDREILLSTTLSSISDTVISIDSRGKILFMNSKGEELTGLSLKNSVGLDLSTIVGRNLIWKSTKDSGLSENENSIKKECLIKNPQNIERYVEYSVAPVINSKLPDDNGFVITIKDITDRRIAESKIIEFEERITSLSEYAGIALYNYNSVTKRYDYISSIIETITGYSYKEFRTLKFVDILVHCEIIKPKNIEDPKDVAEDWYSGKIHEYQSDLLIRKKNGETTWVNDFSRPWFDEDGNVIGSIGMIQDINDKKISEKNLIQSEKEYRGLFENAHDAIIIFEPEGEIILEVNKRACEVYGFDKGELIGESLIKFSKDPQRGHSQVENTLRVGTNHNFETVQYNRNKDEIIFEVNASVVVYKEQKAILSINHDITERKRSEEQLKEYQNHLEELVSKRTKALQESETQFRTLAQNIDDAILRIDKNLIILYANPAIEKVTNKEIETVQGEHLSNIGLETEFESNIVNIIEAVFVTESKSRFEIKVKNDIWLDCNIVPEFNNEGKIKSVLISAREISDIKNAEDMIRRRDNLLQAISNGSMILISENSLDKALYNTIEHVGRSTGVDRIYIFQDETDLTGFNSFSQRYEWTSRDVEPELFNEAFQSFTIDRSGFEEWYDELREGSAVYGSSRIFTEKQSFYLKRRKVESLALIPIFSEEKFWGIIGFDDCKTQKTWSIGEIAALFTLAGNIGSAIRRWEVEKEIKLSNDRWRNLFEYAPEPFYLIHQDAKIADCNNAAIRLLNKSKKELVGTQILDTKLIPKEQSDDFWKSINECKKGKQAYIGEFRIKTNRNSTRIVELRTFPIKLMNQDLILISAHDISLRIKAESEIRNALDKAIELNELKSRFVSMVSHEFRTPLSTILSSIELIDIIGVSMSENEKKDHFTKIINSIDYMTDMLNDVITINRADSGKLVAKRKMVELVDFTLQIIDDLIISTGDDVDVNYEVNKDKFETLIDEKLFRQILTNLLSNSIKYTPYGKSIDCHLEISDNSFEIKVIDQGIGIPQSELEEIFSPFHRASNIKNEPGTGLGLAITKRSVETLGGSIEVYSEIEKGTTFTVKLPIITEI